MKNFILLFILLPVALTAKPEYSMLSGNKCINCHYQPHGGGQRNNLGWYSRKDVSLISPSSLGLEEFYQMISEDNSIPAINATVGFDYRLQSARLGVFNEDTRQVEIKRKFFGMQLAPYVAIKPSEWLNLYGHFNIVEPLYASQQRWSATLAIQPSFDYPTIRGGFIQPSIGTRFDDHTNIAKIVNERARTQPLIPPDYAEWGAEINYESLHWLSLTAGIYKSENLALQKYSGANNTSATLVEKDDMSILGRIEFWPRYFEDKLNFSIGASYLANQEFKLAHLFFNLGLTDELAVLNEYVIGEKTDFIKFNNYSVGLAYQLMESIILTGRIEGAETSFPGSSERYIYKSYIIGGQIYLLPYFELRPEYRISDRFNIDSYGAQWAVQLHLYY